MINIWEYGHLDKIKIICSDDSVFEGIVSDLTDESECSDLERQEDSICIVTAPKNHIEIYQSEIKEIVLIEKFVRQNVKLASGQ